MGRTCVFDTEGDGLLPTLTRLHCGVVIDVETRECFDFKPWQLDDFYLFLEEEVETAVGHNIVDYDFRAIELVGKRDFKRPPKVHDTLIMAKLVWPYDTLYVRDFQLVRQGKLPPRLLKSHSLKAWGYRLGNYKGDFDGPWDVWSEEMHTYMIQDGWVNLDLYLKILEAIGWRNPSPTTYVWPELPFEIEHECAAIVRQQEDNGFSFDRAAAVRLSQDLMNARADLEVDLVDHFGSWWAPLDNPTTGRVSPRDVKRKRPDLPDVTMRRFGKSGKELAPYVGPPFEHYTAGAPYVRIQRVTFSPSSRDHLGQRLQVAYGWKPRKFGANGKPTVDEGTLKEIPESVLPASLRKTLLDYFVITKTLGQLSVGNKSWLKFCATDDGRIHGRIDTCGAITGRGTHRDPNLSQVPAVVKNKDGEILYGLAGGFGFECRSLFLASPGWKLTGADVASLELVMLGHYLHPFDEGTFLERVSDPDRDPHAEHGELTQLPRADTKTVTYAYVYGGGPGRVGEELELHGHEIPELLQYSGLAGILAWKRRIEGRDYREPDDTQKARMAKGAIVIQKFEAGIPGIKDLKRSVSGAAKARKWLKAIDGRKLYVRKPHAALNTLLQGGGAIVCKLWMVLIHRRLVAEGLLPGRDYVMQVAWSHDELQFDHRPELGGIIGAISQEAIRETAERLGLRGPLRTDAKTGSTWAETH